MSLSNDATESIDRDPINTDDLAILCRDDLVDKCRFLQRQNYTIVTGIKAAIYEMDHDRTRWTVAVVRSLLSSALSGFELKSGE